MFRRSSLPVIYQTEANECGLACLAIIASHWGRRLSLETVREIVGATPRGVTLRTLVELAARLGLAARPIKIGLKRLDQVRMPAILHWDMNHFVVLEKVERGHATIIDPATGRTSHEIEDLSGSFTGIAVEFTPNDAIREIKADAPRIFWKTWFRDRVLVKSAAAAIAFTLLMQSAVLSLPLIYKMAIDGRLSTSAWSFGTLSTGIALILFVQLGASIGRVAATSLFGSILAHRISLGLVTHLLSLPLSFFRDRMAGGVVARVQSVEAIKRFITDQAFPLLIDTAISLLAMTFMFVISPQLSVVLITGVTIDIALRVRFAIRERAALQESLEAQSKESAILLESVRAIQTIKLGSAEAARVAVWENRLVENLKLNAGVSTLRGQMASFSAFIVSLEWIAILFIATGGGSGAALTPGILFGFLAYRGLVRERLANVLTATSTLYALGAHFERLDDIMMAPAECSSPPATMNVASGHISLQAVGFGYPGSNQAVLTDVSLEIPGGSFVAITGASGSGKSTLVRLLLGLESVSAGVILVDGAPIESVPRSEWRRHFGVVMQDDTLVSGTILENVAFYADEVDLARVRSACRSAGIDSEIESLPMGYYSFIGDGAGTLSGGQKQRILIARAIYRRPRIIVFDEGTANIDTESELAIAKSLEQLQITRIVIAHRSELLGVADTVYEMKCGRLSMVQHRGGTATDTLNRHGKMGTELGKV